MKAIVTGGSRGIGAAIAKNLKESGFSVVTAARTGADIEVDLSSPYNEGEVSKLDGEYDIVINNAGGNLGFNDPFGPLFRWREVMRLNFESIVEINDLLLPYMIKKKWGRVINICSTSSLENNGSVPYCSAKAALAAYTHSMGRVLAPTGVIMTGLIVGAIATKGGHWDHQTKEHKKRYLKERCPLGKFGEERSIADFVNFLCTDKADFFQGALLPCDGGQLRGWQL